MSKLTKADIDGLVEGMFGKTGNAYEFWCATCPTRMTVTIEEIKSRAYSAAGLTAEGEPKPEKVDVWRRDEPRHWLATGYWDGKTFVPDGAE